MSTHTDWKRIEELAEKATPRPWEAIGHELYMGGTHRQIPNEYDARLIAATANAAPDMAARLRSLNELLVSKITTALKASEKHPFTSPMVPLLPAEASKVLALLTGEEGEGK